MIQRILCSWLVYTSLMTNHAYAQQLTTTTTTTTGTTPGTSTTTSAAVKSLYIPGFDPQPVSADVVGVNRAGRTWAIHRGSATGMDTGLGNFLGTATLVEGALDASLTYANANAQFTIDMQCAFSESTLAVSTIKAQGSTATQTEFISRQPIQGRETLAPTRRRYRARVPAHLPLQPPPHLLRPSGLEMRRPRCHPHPQTHPALRGEEVIEGPSVSRVWVWPCPT
ncbi:hypothetical protein BDN70DRAFT_878935 [Pholiota conissans]|uniref:Dirigent protein n=1 Tax=Pholiota conissans TaxID=109636 RepID=A0A9P5Z3M5_9AGAR|nr:hypothetical protein BDN70DRAFT_878935 [Pholiota conissans]